MNRRLSQTQTLLMEAEAALARLAKNRAAMSRPLPSAPAHVEIPPRLSPPRRMPTHVESQHKKRTLSSAEQTALQSILTVRGFVANADLQRTLGLTMQQASVRLRQLCETGVLLREGPGANSRYRPGTAWPNPQDSETNDPGPQGTRVRAASEADLPALMRLWNSQSQHAYALDNDQKPQPRSNLELFFGKRLRSNRRLLLVAESDSLGAVGYVFAGFDRQPLGPLVGKICDLALDANADASDVGKRLLKAARRWLEDRGVADINVSVPAGNQAAQQLFEQLGFQPNTIEMSVSTANPASADG